MNPLNLIPAPYRLIATIGAVAALALFLYASGYTNGSKRTADRYEAAKVEAIQRAITQAQEIAKQDAEIVSGNVQTGQAIRERTRTIRIKEKNHATANPLPPECVLDDRRVQHINDALSGKDADTTKPDYRLPAASKIGR